MKKTIGGGGGTTNRDWWPEKQRLYESISKLSQHNEKTNPIRNRQYRTEFTTQLDYYGLKSELKLLLTDSQSWWPADYGHYGPFFIRMAWHSAGTYRIQDGRGGAGTGQLRFAPLNSWPDNGNLDKARRLLWPIKQKYGLSISWADLMILAGNVALEDMGFPTFGYAGGREDVWEPEEDGIWGRETKWLSNDRRYNNETTTNNASGCEVSQSLDNPLGAVQMGLIYVNPEGPNSNPSPLLSAHDIRETFSRMAMNDEETVALIAGGHTFGKCHGAAPPDDHVGSEPEGADISRQGLGWQNSYQTGKGLHAITSGLEGAWTPKSPTTWDHSYLTILWENEWILTKSPAGAHQWKPNKTTTTKDKDEPIMLTSDLALKEDPIYRHISYQFYQNPQEFQLAFAKAWYKLTHRDLGPHERCLGPEVPPPQIWQDPIPTNNTTNLIITKTRQEDLKRLLLQRIPNTSILIEIAWASASTYRHTDKRGGANGARIRLQPQIDWNINNQHFDLRHYLRIYEQIQHEYNTAYGAANVSMADLIVLGGCAGIEKACKKDMQVPFLPGRRDALQTDTDTQSFAVLEPRADGFRNYYNLPDVEEEFWLVEKAQLLNLTAPEMTVLLGGLRVLGVGSTSSSSSLTHSVGQLTNDFFINLLSMNTLWKKKNNSSSYEGYDRTTEKVLWTDITRVDLIFGSHSVLRALSEVYAQDEDFFVQEFVKTFTKVMNLDRFDVVVPDSIRSRL